MADQSAVGKVGRVTTRVRGGALPGEVRVVVAGVPHYYIAYCTEPLTAGREILVINNRGGRQLDVEPWGHPSVDVDDV